MDLCVVFLPDGLLWSNHLETFLRKGFSQLSVLHITEDQLRRFDSRQEMSGCKASVIVVTPGLVNMLTKCSSSVNLLNLDVKRSVLFLCGAEMDDFDLVDGYNSPIRERFGNLSSWTMFTHDRWEEAIKKIASVIESFT